MELAVRGQVQAEALPGVVFVVVEALPENPCGRGLAAAGDFQIRRWSAFGSPALDRAFQARRVRTEPDSPFTIHREALIGGIAHRPMLPVFGKAPSGGCLRGQVVEAFANVREFADREVGAMFVNDIV